MDEPVPFGRQSYMVLLGVLFLARGADFLSTWIATPNLLLESNPIAKGLRWRWGLVVNVVLCFGFAFWPLPAIIIATTSALVAARNFQLAWLMRTAGEMNYRMWMVSKLDETPLSLFVFCLLAQTGLEAAVGGVLAWASGTRLVPFGIGMGIVAYALTILVFTFISLWRNRRSVR